VFQKPLPSLEELDERFRRAAEQGKALIETHRRLVEQSRELKKRIRQND
jgi:hypothetical protein